MIAIDSGDQYGGGLEWQAVDPRDSTGNTYISSDDYVRYYKGESIEEDAKPKTTWGDVFEAGVRAYREGVAEGTEPRKSEVVGPPREDVPDNPSNIERFDREFRTWRDSTGKYNVVARFGGMIRADVTLIKPDGAKVRLPLYRLSDEDQAFISDLAKERRLR